MEDRIEILYPELFSEEGKKILLEEIARVEDLRESLYELVEKKVALEKILKDAETKLNKKEGVLFRYLPKKKKPVKEIKNTTNLIFRGLDNTKH